MEMLLLSRFKISSHTGTPILLKMYYIFCGFHRVCICTLSLKSLSPLSSVCFKTSQTTGDVGVACPPSSELETFLMVHGSKYAKL